MKAPVLYAEDDENDAFLVTRAFSRTGINPLVIVSDGDAAIEYLSRKGEKNPLPCLVLLDLKMPRKSGLEVLKWIRNEPTISTLPVLMFTSSCLKNDVLQSYSLGANGYLLKPSKPDEMLALAKSLRDFWLCKNLYIRPTDVILTSKEIIFSS